MAVDYPTMITPVNHIEPVPRRIRATLGAHTILDTTRAMYVWEWPNYPQYYIPVADVDPAVLVDEQHPQRLSRGTARRHSIRVGDIVRAGAARLYTEDAIPGLPGMVRFEWDSAGCLVRGGRAGLRPPAQSLHQGGCAPLDPGSPRRTGRGGAGRILLPGHGFRDRAADPLLPEPD